MHMIERIKNTIGQKCWININKWYNSVLLWYYGFITSNPLIYGVNISFYSRHISRCCNFNFNVINMYPIFACNPYISMESHYYQMLGINFLFAAHSTNVFFSMRHSTNNAGLCLDINCVMRTYRCFSSPFMI